MNKLLEMTMDALIKRINELAAKAKSEIGLTEAELEERAELRQEYLRRFRSQFETQLHHVTVVDPKGNDITPQKLRQSKRRMKN